MPTAARCWCARVCPTQVASHWHGKAALRVAQGLRPALLVVQLALVTRLLLTPVLRRKLRGRRLRPQKLLRRVPTQRRAQRAARGQGGKAQHHLLPRPRRVQRLHARVRVWVGMQEARAKVPQVALPVPSGPQAQTPPRDLMQRPQRRMLNVVQALAQVQRPRTGAVAAVLAVAPCAPACSHALLLCSR
jgi:hypothetical protein